MIKIFYVLNIVRSSRRRTASGACMYWEGKEYELQPKFFATCCSIYLQGGSRLMTDILKDDKWRGAVAALQSSWPDGCHSRPSSGDEKSMALCKFVGIARHENRSMGMCWSLLVECLTLEWWIRSTVPGSLVPCINSLTQQVHPFAGHYIRGYLDDVEGLLCTYSLGLMPGAGSCYFP